MENKHYFIIIKGELDACFHKIEELYKAKVIAIYSSISANWKEKSIRELFPSGEDKMKQYLTMVGLAEYSYFSRKTTELSETEKIRLFVAQCLEEKAEVIVLDENSFQGEENEAIIGCFLNIKKVGKRNKVPIVTVLKNVENEENMFPDEIIEVSQDGTNIIIRQNAVLDETELVMNGIEYRLGTLEDYKALEKYHYIKLPETEIDYICCASYHGVIAAVVVYISPIRELGIENIKRNNIFQYILKSIMCCSRIVANPHFRGLGVTKRLIQYGIETVPCQVMECRSSMLNHTKVLEKWGGTEINRDYRKKVPCYNALCAFLNKWNIHLDKEYDSQFIDKLKDEEKKELRQLVLLRLKEIDQYQWIYYEQLVRMSSKFSEEDYKLAAESYVGFYQNQYKTMALIKLLGMCRNWDSAAYILKLGKEEQVDE